MCPPKVRLPEPPNGRLNVVERSPAETQIRHSSLTSGFRNKSHIASRFPPETQTSVESPLRDSGASLLTWRRLALIYSPGACEICDSATTVQVSP